MLEETQKMFGGMFGKIPSGMCRLTMNGNIAVKAGNGYKTYNLKKESLTNVTNFCFDIGSDFFFVMPTTKVEIGDIILVDNKPKCVLEVYKRSIKVIDYESSEIREIVPERHVFMGNIYFYGKIVSLIGNNFKKKGMGGVMKMMLMSQMMGGKSNMGDMSQMMMMSMFMGKDNPFDGMFDNLDFDVVSADDEDEEDDDSCGVECECDKSLKR